MSLAEWALRSQARQPKCSPWKRPLIYGSAGTLANRNEDELGRRGTWAGSGDGEHGWRGTVASKSKSKPLNVPLEDNRTEWYYMQTDLPRALRRDVDFSAPLFQLISGAVTQESREADAQACFRQSQAPRLWLSPAGSETPMHYDRSASFLVQVFGRKKLLFLPPEALEVLQPFPDEHLLARRVRVDISQRLATVLSDPIGGEDFQLNGSAMQGSVAGSALLDESRSLAGKGEAPLTDELSSSGNTQAVNDQTGQRACIKPTRIECDGHDASAAGHEGHEEERQGASEQVACGSWVCRTSVRLERGRSCTFSLASSLLLGRYHLRPAYAVVARDAR
jgi:hypothetical protein